MKLDPGFATHWKTERLIDRCGPAAVVGLLRLWGDCQVRRRYTGLVLAPAKLAAMMRYEGDHSALWEAMTDAEAPWLDAEEGGTWAIHGFAEHNKQIMHLWEAGKKGGRPKSPPTPPSNTDNTIRGSLTPFANHMVSNENHLVFVTPTLDEVKAAASLMGVAADRAEIWYHETESRPISPTGHWTDRSGRPLSNWRSALKAWDGKWSANEAARGRQNGHNGHNGHAKPESVWSLQQRIEAAQKEVDRICANPANKEQIPDSFDRRLRPEPMAKVKALKASISEMRQRLAGVEVAA
jgi:hypothetical protein